MTGASDIRIRPGTPADAAGMAALLNGVIAEGKPVLLTGPFSVEAERAFLEGMPARAAFHVVEAPEASDAGTHAVNDHGDRHASPVVVAAQVFVPYAEGMPAHDHVAEMGTWVREGWRRQGLGRSLWERTLAAARSRGFGKILTDIRADNLESLAYHLALGFTVAGTAHGLAVMGGRPYDVVFVERPL
jgi:L-amino acid N-acyltransferase YncA